MEVMWDFNNVCLFYQMLSQLLKVSGCERLDM